MHYNIMIVDDSSFMRMLLKRILHLNGHSVVGEVESGARALEVYKEVSPDLVLMDISLPDLDVTSIIKSMKELRNSVKIIACFSPMKKLSTKEILRMNVDKYINKPFQEYCIIDTIKSLEN